MPGRDLTTPAAWDQLWGRSRPTRFSDRLRPRLRAARARERLLATLLDSTGREAPLDVLELGCAPGSMLVEIHRLRPEHRLRGLDSAVGGLDQARQLLKSEGVTAELLLGDIRTAELPPVDLVVSFGLVEHFDRPVDILRHHRRFLRPGGVAAVTVPNYAHPAVVAMLRRFSRETLETHNLEIMSTGSLAAAFEDAGFSDVQAGESGGALVPTSRVQAGLTGSVFRVGARAWNVTTSALPEGWPWCASIWAVGSQP